VQGEVLQRLEIFEASASAPRYLILKGPKSPQNRALFSNWFGLVIFYSSGHLHVLQLLENSHNCGIFYPRAITAVYVCPHTCISLSLYVGGGAAAARDQPQLDLLALLSRRFYGSFILIYVSRGRCCSC
jgi:hypothetical protein